MRKSNKRDKVIKYVNAHPEATVKEVATKVGVTYGYAYKIMKRAIKEELDNEVAVARELIKNKVAPGSFIRIRSDGSTASYYQLPEGAKELQDLISHKDMNAQIGEIFRSCYRYGEVSHSDKLRDAKKIKYYAEAEIKRLERLSD